MQLIDSTPGCTRRKSGSSPSIWEILYPERRKGPWEKGVKKSIFQKHSTSSAVSYKIKIITKSYSISPTGLSGSLTGLSIFLPQGSVAL